MTREEVNRALNTAYLFDNGMLEDVMEEEAVYELMANERLPKEESEEEWDF